MLAHPSSRWRVLVVAGGLTYFIGAFFHPRDGGIGAMLVNPAWVPSHAAVLLGVVLIILGLVAFRRAVPRSPTMGRWLAATIALGVVQAVEMALHTMAWVDAAALPDGAFHAGLRTPVLTSHIWLSTIAFTPFAVAFLGLIWTGARERSLGSFWFLWVGVIGALAYGSVMWLVFIADMPGAGILFPVAHLAVPLWFILAGLRGSGRATAA